MDPTSDLFGIVGKVIAGTYRVEEVVAEGGFGVVYKAHHKGFRATVALKCLKIPGELSEQHRKQFLEQFRSEAEVLFRLSALLPNIVRPLHVDAFQTREGRFVPFMALEWLDGWTLDSVVAQRAEQGRPPIALKKLVRLLTPVARALEQAHNMPGPTGTLSIVHRDMKPENLFVALVGGEQLIKILDFGISKVKSTAGQLAGRESQTMDSLVSFSPAYGAPEQWLPKRFGQTGPWTDVWGTALTIVETIKGAAVVDGDQAAMMGTIIDPARRPTPRNEGVLVSDEVEAIFAKALAVDPRDRYQSMAAFWDQLLDALDLDLLGNPKRVTRPDPRAEGHGALRMEQIEAALSPRLSFISGLRLAASGSDGLRPPERAEVGVLDVPFIESVVPSAGLDHGAMRAAAEEAPVARAYGRPGMPASTEIDIPKPPATPQFESSVQRRRQASHSDGVASGLGSASHPIVSRTADTESPPAPEAQGRPHGARNLQLAPTSVVPPKQAPARAYPVRVTERPSLLKVLLPAMALLALAIAITLLDRAYATSNGVLLALGPLRASWLGAGCFVAALTVGISSVWRSLD
jgi:serine/threonine protein kinase